MPSSSSDRSPSDRGNPQIVAWLRDQTKRDASVYLTAAGFMAVVALFATVAMLIFITLMLLALTGGGLGYYAVIPAALILVGLWYVHKTFDRPVVRRLEIHTKSRGPVELNISPLTGTSWLMFLDRSSESENPVVRFVLNILLLVPRLWTLTLRMYEQSRSCEHRDFVMISEGLDRLMQGGRDPVEDLIDAFPDRDPQKLVGELTNIEGVVVLPGTDPSLTLTPSFMDEFEQWQRDRARKKRSAGY